MRNAGWLSVALLVACSGGAETSRTAATHGDAGAATDGGGGATAGGGSWAMAAGATAGTGGSAAGSMGGAVLPGGGPGERLDGGNGNDAATPGAGGAPPGGAGGDGATPACACNADVNGDGAPVFFDMDGALVSQCLGQDPSAPCAECRAGTCAAADIDCNGRIDHCDTQRLGCAEVGEGCCDVACGACEIPETADPLWCSGGGLDAPCCRMFDEDVCTGLGNFLGADVPCPE